MGSMAITLIIATTDASQAGHMLSTRSPSSNPPSSRRVVYDAYVLGPGDSIQVEVLDMPELSGVFTIGPDGTIYLPRLRALNVEGLTVEEIRYFLAQQFKTYVKDPHLYIKPVAFRPVRVYIGGEVARPGYYTLSGQQVIRDQFQIQEPQFLGPPNNLPTSPSQYRSVQSLKGRDLSGFLGVQDSGSKWPTLFDCIRAAQGVTPFSNLSQVQVVRKQPLSLGGGKLRATVDFWRLISSGDESVNIRIFDGDVITISQSTKVLRDQLLAASRSNLSPDNIEVYVSGRVKEPGARTLPQGATLNQAIASAGGVKLLRGQIEFLRFTASGETDRRLISLSPSAEAGSYKNPVLISGDVVRVNDSLFSAGVEVLNEISVPLVGIYSVYSLFKPYY